MSINRSSKAPWFMAVVNSSLVQNGGFTSELGVKSIANNFPNVLTSKIIPDSISSNKPINYASKATPGGRTSIPQFGNFGATEINFSLTHANFNNQLGVVGVQKFFELLRNPEGGIADQIGQIAGNESTPFIPNPQVLYYYGTGSVPMLYFVTKCDFDLSSFNVNGFPQVIKVTLDLVLDETGVLFNLERTFRFTVQTIANASGIQNGFQPSKGTKNPYYTKGGIIPGRSRFFGNS